MPNKKQMEQSEEYPTRADLHNHIWIGFHPPWPEIQGFNPESILHSFVDKCLEKNLGIIAVTSQTDNERCEVIHDRLEVLKKQALSLPEEYKTDTLGENILIVGTETSAGEKLVYIVNGQTVVVRDGERQLDHLVVGTNKVRNLRCLRDTIKNARELRAIQIIEHPYLLEHFGVGEETAKEILDEVDAIEGHNAQFPLYSFLGFIPLAGIYNRGVNKKAKRFAHKYDKPYTASSDAHQLRSVGRAYITLRDMPDTSSEEGLIESLRGMVREGNNAGFETYEGYEPLHSWLSWTWKFRKGTKNKKERTS